MFLGGLVLRSAMYLLDMVLAFSLAEFSAGSTPRGVLGSLGCGCIVGAFLLLVYGEL